MTADDELKLIDCSSPIASESIINNLDDDSHIGRRERLREVEVAGNALVMERQGTNSLIRCDFSLCQTRSLNFHLILIIS